MIQINIVPALTALEEFSFIFFFVGSQRNALAVDGVHVDGKLSIMLCL